MNYGPNIAPNPQFVGSAAPYLLGGDAAPNIHEWTNERLHIKRDGGDAYAITPVGLIVPGVSFKVNVGVEVISGTGRLLWTGGSLNFTTSGEKQVIFTPTGAGGLYLYASANTEVYYDWITVKRGDQSMSTVVIGIRDFDGDKPQTSATLGPVTDGPSYVAREAQAAAVREAVNAVCGNIWRYQFLAIDTEPADTNAASQVIQANHRWKVTFIDSVTGDKVYWYIPTADLTVADLLLTGSSKHNPATQAWIDFKAAVNGILINKKTGSTISVEEIEYEE